MQIPNAITGVACLIIALVLIGGCVTQDTHPASVTPVQDLSQLKSDPIEGTWHWNAYGGSKTIFYTFNPDGSYSTSDSMNQGKESGTWTKDTGNRYNVSVKGNTVVFVYQPETDTVAKASSPTARFYPEGKGPAIISSSSVDTPVQATTVTTQQKVDLISALSGGTINKDVTDPAKLMNSTLVNSTIHK